ncbi:MULTISPECIES: hypothetical protein [unclassified Tenacibaculum]|uniref:hypothetical protein n=1 Tax=unclassified Tenacibaculum TaxID=2635139 RepID=UPI00237C205E|nr:hypothetical protein [Tenacibaculum sp. L6]MDE0536851.1 hypothetical protein [Tenacibaculum sp. L6]
MKNLYKEYPISIKEKADAEKLLEKDFFSGKRKDTVKISTTFFHNKTKIDFYDEQIWVRQKITPNFALIIPFASLLIIIYLIIKSNNFYVAENIGLLFATIFTNYLLFIHLAETTHTKIQNEIFIHLYNIAKKNLIFRFFIIQ